TLELLRLRLELLAANREQLRRRLFLPVVVSSATASEALDLTPHGTVDRVGGELDRLVLRRSAPLDDELGRALDLVQRELDPACLVDLPWAADPLFEPHEHAPHVLRVLLEPRANRLHRARFIRGRTCGPRVQADFDDRLLHARDALHRAFRGSNPELDRL